MKKILKIIAGIFLLTSFIILAGCSKESEVYKPMEPAKAQAEFIKDVTGIGITFFDNDITRNTLDVVSTIGHNKNGYIAYYQATGFDGIMIIDRKNKRIARAYPYSGHPDIFEIPSFRFNRQVRTLVFKIYVYDDDINSPDKGFGKWDQGCHLIPVFASFDFDRNGNIKINRLTSGMGENPRHLQGPIQDEKNKELIQLLFSELTELNVAMIEQNKYFIVY